MPTRIQNHRPANPTLKHTILLIARAGHFTYLCTSSQSALRLMSLTASHSLLRFASQATRKGLQPAAGSLLSSTRSNHWQNLIQDPEQRVVAERVCGKHPAFNRLKLTCLTAHVAHCRTLKTSTDNLQTCLVTRASCHNGLMTEKPAPELTIGLHRYAVHCSVRGKCLLNKITAVQS